MPKIEGTPISYKLSGLQAYEERGELPGPFLTAVLRNDLIGAITNASGDDLKNIHEWVRFILNHLPDEIWGTPEKVKLHSG